MDLSTETNNDIIIGHRYYNRNIPINMIARILSRHMRRKTKIALIFISHLITSVCAISFNLYDDIWAVSNGKIGFYRDVRFVEKLEKRKQKLQCDIEFLKLCKHHNLMPNFTYFKTSTSISYMNYKRCQKIILNDELSLKYKDLNIVNRNVNGLLQNIQKAFIDFGKENLYSEWRRKIKLALSSQKRNINEIHSKKLFYLGFVVSKRPRSILIILQYLSI